MKRLAAVGGLMVAVVGVAWAAAAYENADLKIRVEPPADFVKAENPGEDDEFIGKPLGVYLSPDAAETAGAFLIHHMNIPAGADYDTFKSTWPDQLKQAFGDTYKLLEQKDVKVGDRVGFLMEFKAPGDGTKPDPNGNIPHHLRWIFLKDGDSKLIGLLYASRDEAWSAFKAKFAASEKTLKALN